MSQDRAMSPDPNDLRIIRNLVAERPMGRQRFGISWDEADALVAAIDAAPRAATEPRDTQEGYVHGRLNGFPDSVWPEPVCETCGDTLRHQGTDLYCATCRTVRAAPRAATEPPLTPKELRAQWAADPEWIAAYRAEYPEDFPEPLTRERLAAAVEAALSDRLNTYVNSLHAGTVADAILAALTPTSAPEPGS